MNPLTIQEDDLNRAIELLRKRLLGHRDKKNILWQGELSSSAVSTALASFALTKVSHPDTKTIEKARNWLADNINNDGGWGDTKDSKSNPSATLLARASLLLDEEPGENISAALSQSEQWINKKFQGSSSLHIIKGVKNYYGRDLTFSVPILTICALSPMFNNDRKVWDRIPRLPFEMSVFPHQFYHLLRLPVVSYALPALIAVGIAQFKHNKNINPLTKIIRHLSIPKALKKLTSITPAHGGFIEAVPLTAFVAICLSCSGFSDHLVVKKAIGFLAAGKRTDGSWPIDTNLSQWLSSLAVKALKDSPDFSEHLKQDLAEKFLNRQFKTHHPFTHAKPGGWGWTDLEGAVPDADDTAGILTALAILSPLKATDAINSGIHWLLKLMNNDGGIPTFCKGWGKLPFDRSCPDISSHALLAFSLWHPYIKDNLKSKTEQAIARILIYLKSSRDKENAWTPLWFGDQNSEKHTNRVYGTATVLINLKGQPDHKIKHLTAPALKWILTAQNDDGGWGGEPSTPSFFETTALAVTALSIYNIKSPGLESGVNYLLKKIIENKGIIPPSPFGLYFALLWYDEILYPLTFGLRALEEFKKSNA